MAITQAMCTSFKQEVLQGLHDFTVTTGDTFKAALYDSSASLSADTTEYSSNDEVASGGNYTAGGETLTNITPATSGTTAYCDFSDAVWSSATFTAAAVLIYNSTNGNRAVAVLDFGGDRSASGQDFTVVFPAANATSAVVRIA